MIQYKQAKIVFIEQAIKIKQFDSISVNCRHEQV